MNKTFSYPHTCPKIDKLQQKIIDAVDSAFSNYVDGLFGAIGIRHETHTVTKAFLDCILSDIQDAVDEFRDINSDLRKAAEDQIEQAYEEVDELEDMLNDLKNRISNLEIELG